MKKLQTLLLAAVMLLCLCACGKDTAPALSGAGTAEAPYRISTAGELRKMAELINEEDTGEIYGAAHYLLTADIELSTSPEWIPIGTEKMPFQGVLDGDGHTVSGIRIHYRDPLAGQPQRYFGFFGKIQGGTVRDLTISNSALRAEGDGSVEVAAVAAYVRDGILENCRVTSTVSVTSNYHAAGICASLNGESILRGCTNAASVTATGTVGTAAGIVVRAEPLVEHCANEGPILSEGDAAGIANTANGGLADCRNEGAVTASNGYAAGVVCRFGDGALNHRENDDTVTLLRCINTGDVLSASDPAGGIAVRCSTGHLVDCVNRGNVTSPMEAGGIFAYFNQSVFGAACERFTVTGCVNSGAVTNSQNAAIYSVGGICGILYASDTDHVFENCTNSGPIFSGEAAGGIIGSCDGQDIRLLGCVNSGAVTGVGVCGGIVGDAAPCAGEDTEEILFIAENCRNEGEVYVARDGLNFGGAILLDSYAGGILGRLMHLPTEPDFTQVRIADCENTGRLDGEDADTHFWRHDLCGSWADAEA